MRYLPHSAEEVAAMLETVGAASLDDLFSTIPENLRFQGKLELPEPMGELDLVRHLEELATSNVVAGSGPGATLSFLGGGAYSHHIPAAVDAIASRGEFFTAYTPYQPEVSQGTLQVIFEFQTMVASLLGLDVANASLYDGATATVEAAMLARRTSRRPRILVSTAVHPEYREVLRTYLGKDVVEVAAVAGVTRPEDVEASLAAGDFAGVVVQHPDFFGALEDVGALAEVAHRHDSLFLATFTEPLAFGLLTPPGTLGADVACGEGQSFGIPMSFGGPGLGLFATRDRLVRAMPGRLVGRTTDLSGRVGYVLTLATREQHIRREKATSNICSNEGLCALMATVYLSLTGRRGLRDLATLNLSGAEYLKAAIRSIPGLDLAFPAPTFNEFVVRAQGRKAAALLSDLRRHDILGGLDLGRWYPDLADCFLVTVTETATRDDLDRYAGSLREVMGAG